MTPDPARGDTARTDDEERQLFWEALANTLRPYAGWIFYGFGALFVLIGYLGISGEAVVAKQLPFLISGGIGGILLAVIGAYFLGIEELRRDGGRLDRMEKQIEELHRALLERADAPAPPSPVGHLATASNGHATVDHVVVVEAGESFHRSECALVEGKSTTSLDPAAASGRGLRPCPVCEPALSLS